MLEPFRSDFNARFTAAKYHELKTRLNRETGTEIQFRIAETPCFFPAELLDRMIRTGIELTHRLVDDPGYLQKARAAIPPPYRVPGQGRHPHFMTADFGLVREADGELGLRLVEMQAFPSIFGFQPGLARAYIDVFDLDPHWHYLFGGQTEETYWPLLRDVVVGGHDPQDVVLLELDPLQQKTLPDFRMHEQHLGVRVVNVRDVVKQGRRLFYPDPARGSALHPIRRIYNRVIVDEIVRKGVALPFDYRDDLDLEWAGHPNWYFAISKFSIPFLDHPAVPPAAFLDGWLRGEGRDRLPPDRQRWILKPLYSFAGKGIQFAPSDADLLAIAPDERGNYLLQERVAFEPVIRTPGGLTQAEVRILYVWPEGKSMVPMTSLVRMGRGLMMGVDHNRDRAWVGGSAAFFFAET